MNDLDESKIDAEKPKRFAVRSFNDTAVLLLKRRCDISVKGRMRIRCIQGKAYMLGFCITPDGKYYPAFSPNSHSLLTLTTSKSRNLSHDSERLSNTLKAEISSVSDEEVAEVLNVAKKCSAVLLLKAELSLDFISDLDHFQHLLDGVSRKHEQSRGVFLDAVNLQIVENAPNQMVITDYYKEISDQFLETFNSNGSAATEIPVIAICGGKDCGKSTFCRYLVNKALNSCQTVAFLDCDLGQTEFTPPGCVSLSLITAPILGPPFTHPRQPLSSCYVGSTSPGHNPRYYVQCLKHVYSRYSQMQTKPPLVINTMGWVEGLGIYFLVEALLMARPTIVVQLESPHVRQNLPELRLSFVAEFVEGPEFLRLKCRGKNDMTADNLEYELYNVKSPVTDSPENKRRLLGPADLRSLMSMSYLGQNLGHLGKTASLHDVPLHRVLLRDVAVRIFDADIPRSHILCAINASFIALCSIPDEMLAGAHLPMFPKQLKQKPMECLGFGLVHHVIVKDEAVFIISPLPESLLSRVNCLMSGCDGVPKHLLLKLKVPDQCPYVGNPVECIGCSSVKPRGREMYRKRQPNLVKTRVKMSTQWVSEILELSRHLKQERLFTCAEKEQLHSLHSTIADKSQKLYHVSWIARQQKNELDRLILADRNTTPAACCQKVNALEVVMFIDGYKVLTYHESKIGRFLKLLREMPSLVASCLVLAEKTSVETMQNIAGIVMSGLYGNVVLQDDELYVMQVLKHLIDLQVSQSTDPRRLLRKGSCAFSMIFKLLNEGHFSSRLFLTSALHKPVMQLLIEDEWFYDIDPERALHRFPPHERLRRFGHPGTDDYEQKIQRYRDLTTDKLVALVSHFVISLQANMYCFPPSLAWIISQLYHTLIKVETVEQSEARAICADLVLTFFICPAVCDPEPYGITTDAPIGYIARHNLIQVGQILQVLAISKPEEIDNKTKDLYSKFPPGFMSFLLDALLDTPLVNTPVPSLPQTSNFSRSAALLSCSELTELVGFLHGVVSGLKDDSTERKQMEDLLTTCNLPPQSVIQALCSNQSLSHSTHNSPNTTPHATPPGTPVSSKKLSRGKDKKKSFLSPPGMNDVEDVDSVQFAEDVLVISFGVAYDCPGMLSEQKVLEQEVRQKKMKYNSLLPGEDDPISESDIIVHEKRTRFSLSHDQDSIATSDNLEAISEAASSHSVTSDLDNENDNLSDMMSANVSGRGTPNVSGRDTPISQADSQMEGPEERQPMVPDLPVIVQKTNREDVTDRFGKFEIKHELERDEAKSTVSDTWSTDVLASDSEPPEQNQLDRLEEVAEEPASNVLGGVQEVMEISETASDAWSTDVLASDTSERQAERLLELDQDDVASVSSRGVGPGSEAGELLPGEATSDNTPQASGNQSPHDSSFEIAETDSETRSPKISMRLTKDTIAIASQASNPQPSSNRHSYTPSSSSSEQSIFRMNRYIHDESDRQVQTSRFSEFLATGKRGRSIHCPVPLKFLDSKTAANFVAAEPREFAQRERVGSEDYDRGDREGDAGIVYSSDECNLNEIEGSDKDHKSPISKASSDVCLNCLESSALDLSIHSSSSVGSLVDFPERQADSGVNSTATMGSSVSVDTLTNDFSDGLKLTEHQNEKLDERRLSAVSNSFFDPLLQDNVMTRQTSSTGDIPVFKSTAYVEQGARPKTTSSCYPAPPKISVSQTSAGTQSMTSKGRGALGIPNGKVQASGSKNVRGEADHGDVSLSSDSPAKAADLATPSRIATKPLTILVTTQEAPGSNLVSKDEDDKKQDKPDKRKPGFFHTFRERITRGSFPVPVQLARGGKRKVTKLSDEVFRPSVVIDSEKGLTLSGAEATDDALSKHKLSGSAGSKTEDMVMITDTSDEILAKYRTKPTTKTIDGSTGACLLPAASGSRPVEEEEGPPAYDANNLEGCKAFLDAKKKLRLVLSNADFQVSIHGYQYSGSARNPLTEPKENELIAFLKLQLAEAINLQDKDLIAQLHETIRCLHQFDNQETKKLLKTMRDEYRSRSPYVAYLVRCRQGLLSTLALIERLLVRVDRNKNVVNKYLLSVFVRLFLEKKEKALMKFIAEFQKLTVSDEKTDLVENFLAYLHKEMEEDRLWQVARAGQLEEAKLYVERSIMSHIYTHAMFPNGDGDILRDQILCEHMKKLSKVITPSHKDLRIPKMYHYECPWPAAQTEIYMINAYKTPKDKLQCILRCSSTIMNLLSMANEKSVPAADDFMPVLIYVLIKANIPNLLSTVQYIKSFYEKRVVGEELYWWMQFASAIEFIKTMDYNE